MLQRVAEPEHPTPLPELSRCQNTEDEENDGETATDNRENNSINMKGQTLIYERAETASRVTTPHNGHPTELLNLP